MILNRLHPILIALLLAATSASATTVGDIARFQGEQDNFISGTGIVFGLNGTGDGTAAARQALASMLIREGIHVSASDVASRNIAVVRVHARLGPFLREGQAIDVTVSSIYDAKSLFGGQLEEVPLSGADDRVYCTAAGPVTVGGFSAAGDAAEVRQNHVVVGRIPNGGIITQELKWDIVKDGTVGLLLRQPDYRNAAKVVEAINAAFPDAARAVDAGQVSVRLPQAFRERAREVAFLARIMDIKVDPAIPSRVVLNERSGTIIAGGDITLGPVSISHGNLIIAISETPEVSQPSPLSRGGETKVVPRTQVEAQEQGSPVVRIPKGTHVADMAAALNAVGISPRDMIVIFQMLKRAGALHAELVVE